MVRAPSETFENPFELVEFYLADDVANTVKTMATPGIRLLSVAAFDADCG